MVQFCTALVRSHLDPASSQTTGASCHGSGVITAYRMSSVNPDGEGLPVLVLASQLQNDHSGQPNLAVQLDADSEDESISSENQTAVALPEETDSVWKDTARQSSLTTIDLPGDEVNDSEEELGAADEALQASLSHLMLRPSASVCLSSHAAQACVQAAISEPTEVATSKPDSDSHARGNRGGESAPGHSMSEIGAASSRSGELRPWETYSKHVLVLTSSGKPIYSLHGDPDSLAGLTALATALISVVADHGDKLQHILAGRVQALMYRQVATGRWHSG